MKTAENSKPFFEEQFLPALTVRLTGKYEDIMKVIEYSRSIGVQDEKVDDEN